MWYTCLPNSFSSASNTTRFFFRRTNATTTVPRIEPDFPCILRIYLNLREHGAGGLSDHGRPLHFRAEGILRRESAHVLTPQVYVFVSLHLAVHLVRVSYEHYHPHPGFFSPRHRYSSTYRGICSRHQSHSSDKSSTRAAADKTSQKQIVTEAHEKKKIIDHGTMVLCGLKNRRISRKSMK